MIAEILTMAAPLLLATLGALASEYAGVLAVFMEGTITIAGFVCIAVTAFTGNPALGIAAACFASMLLLYAVAAFTEKTRANPFLTGLAVNFLAAGILPRLSSALFGTQGVVSLASVAPNAAAAVDSAFYRAASFPVALSLAAAFALATICTRAGLILRITGSSGEALAARGIDAGKYRAASWMIAAAFGALAGCTLTLGLGAYVPNVSAGRGWTALAAVYLGFKNPILCVASALVFAGAGYLADIIQGTGRVPTTVVLGLPYALALLVFVFVGKKKE